MKKMVQGGIVETNITIGKAATVSAVVSEGETARTVGSGSMEVLATPMMIALMERAACEALADGLTAGQTSVGTHIAVSHVAASPIGSSVFATATITSVAGRKIEFSVTANDGAGEIGRGTHTRVIVEEARFMAKAEAR